MRYENYSNDFFFYRDLMIDTKEQMINNKAKEPTTESRTVNVTRTVSLAVSGEFLSKNVHIGFYKFNFVS